MICKMSISHHKRDCGGFLGGLGIVNLSSGIYNVICPTQEGEILDFILEEFKIFRETVQSQLLTLLSGLTGVIASFDFAFLNFLPGVNITTTDDTTTNDTTSRYLIINKDHIDEGKNDMMTTTRGVVVATRPSVMLSCTKRS